MQNPSDPVNTYPQLFLGLRSLQTGLNAIIQANLLIGNTMFSTFELSRLPRVIFGRGTLTQVAKLSSGFGRRALIVTGAKTLDRCASWPDLCAAFAHEQVSWEQVHIPGEPSPDLIDSLVESHARETIDVVIGIGGGSALDAAKAIAGLLRPGNSVRDHLEGVGPELPYLGPTTPFIAVPTTAGTGSEATKNAVLSEGGEGGFKKSFRDERLVAECAVIDPDLLATCPPAIIAANGMDAFTQLLESFVSTRANPLCDTLALDGLTRVRGSLLPWFNDPHSPDAAPYRADMAYAALLSGITLAQVGLGSVHGLAAPLGAFFPISHGVACGTLVAEATRFNIEALRARLPDSPALKKYATVGRLLTLGPDMDDLDAQAALVSTLERWTQTMALPRLSAFGIDEKAIPKLVTNCRGSSMKTNPIGLTDAEVASLLRARI